MIGILIFLPGVYRNIVQLMDIQEERMEETWRRRWLNSECRNSSLIQQIQY